MLEELWVPIEAAGDIELKRATPGDAPQNFMSSQPLLGAGERLRKSESSQSWEQNVTVLTLRARPCW